MPFAKAGLEAMATGAAIAPAVVRDAAAHSASRRASRYGCAQHEAMRPYFFGR